ncbi:MAG: hypothetical protein ACI4KA_01080 [Oscillospiraceae bacterium]
MLIRITNTTFGLVVNGIIKPKSPKDPPFDVDEELGKRLVREGIAEAMDDTYCADVQPESNDNGNDEDTDESGDFGIPKYDAATSKSDLQSIANEYGIAVAESATKQELIKALDDFFADALPDDSEDE